MKNTTLLLTAALAMGACSSQPSMDRPGAPGRPEIPRPEGVEPEGLTEMRDTLSAQRSDARSMDNALNLNATPATQYSDQTFLESIFTPIADAMEFVRGILGGGATATANRAAATAAAQATR